MDIQLTKQSLFQRLQQQTQKPIDAQIFEQLYKRTIEQNDYCTYNNFEKSRREAIQLLQQKIIKTKEVFSEEQDNLQALIQKPQFNTQYKSQTPVRLNIKNAQVLNLQVRNNFLIGNFAVVFKIQDYFNHVTQMKPSYDLAYPVNVDVQIQNVGDTLLITMLSDSNISVQNSQIVIPIYTLQIGQFVTEVLNYKTENELMEIEISYEVTVLDGQMLNLQIEQEKQVCQSYIQKYQDELFDYELQLQDLQQMNMNMRMNMNNDIENEITLNNNNYNNLYQEPSQNTYGIGVPDYYKKPLELQSDVYKIQEISYDWIIWFIIGLIIASLIGVLLNSFLDCSVIGLGMMIYLVDRKYSMKITVIFISSIIYDCGLAFLNVQDWVSTDQTYQKLRIGALWIFGALQIYKLFLIVKNC